MFLLAMEFKNKWVSSYAHLELLSSESQKESKNWQEVQTTKRLKIFGFFRMEQRSLIMEVVVSFSALQSSTKIVIHVIGKEKPQKQYF